MTYLVTILILLALVSGWIAVQTAARRYAARHPEFGPAREEGEERCGGCSSSCAGHCERSGH